MNQSVVSVGCILLVSDKRLLVSQRKLTPLPSCSVFVKSPEIRNCSPKSLVSEYFAEICLFSCIGAE